MPLPKPMILTRSSSHVQLSVSIKSQVCKIRRLCRNRWSCPIRRSQKVQSLHLLQKKERKRCKEIKILPKGSTCSPSDQQPVGESLPRSVEPGDATHHRQWWAAEKVGTKILLLPEFSLFLLTQVLLVARSTFSSFRRLLQFGLVGFQNGLSFRNSFTSSKDHCLTALYLKINLL